MKTPTDSTLRSISARRSDILRSFNSAPLLRAIAVGTPLLLLYIATQAQNISAAHDAAEYLLEIRNGLYFHPHHLFFNATAALWIGAMQSLFPSLEAAACIGWLNAIFGAACFALVVQILQRRIGLTPTNAILGALPSAFSFGVWFYSTTVEVYIIPLFFLLLALYLLTAKELPMRRILLAAGVHGVAVLFHQVHVLFTIPAIYLLWRHFRQRPGSPWGDSLIPRITAYLLLSGAVAAIPYFIIGVFVLDLHSPAAFTEWLFRYTRNGGFWYGLSLGTLVKAAIGFSKSIIGGEFLFAIEAIRAMLLRALPDKWLQDQEFLVRQLPQQVAFVLAVLSVVIAGLTGFLLFNIRRWRALLLRRFETASPLIVFGAAYSLFFFFWEPSNPEFWIPQSVLFWMLIAGVAFAPSLEAEAAAGMPAHGAQLTLAAIALLLLVVNGLGSIRWLMSEENDYFATQATVLSGEVRESDVVGIADDWIMKDILQMKGMYRHCSFMEIYRSAPTPVAAYESLCGKIDQVLVDNGRFLAVHDAWYPPAVLLRTEGDGYGLFLSEIRKRYAGRLDSIPAGAGAIYVIR